MTLDTKDRAGLDSLRLYTLTELEGIIGVTHQTLFTYIKAGKLHAVKVGGKWKVTEENVKRFLNGEPQDTGAIV